MTKTLTTTTATSTATAEATAEHTAAPGNRHDLECRVRERALAASTNGVMIVAMRAPDPVFVYVNPAFERISGYAAADVLGRNPRILQRDDTRQSELVALRQAIAAQQPCSVRLRNYRRDGSLFWNELAVEPVFDDHGSLTHYIGIQNDVSEAVVSQEVLRRRTERLNAVFDLSPDGFVVLDEDGFVSIVNAAFERLTGLAAINLVGRHRETLDSLLRRRSLPDPDGTGAARPAFVDTEPMGAETGQGSDTADVLRLALPEPRTLLRRTRHSPCGIGDTVMTFRDITREAEMDRMKSEFLSTAAHELRTPMTSIYGFTELMLRRDYGHAQNRDIISTVHRQAGLLVKLVNELLDLARIESRGGAAFMRSVQPLQPIIDNAVESLMVMGDEREVVVTARPETTWVDVDHDKLILALTNVLSNAFKYSPACSEVRIDLLDRRRNDTREIGIAVTDRGIGMSGDEMSRLFERFYRADASGSVPGTGLGMSITRQIVELHGGEVVVQSERGVGTRVTFWLPVVHRLVREG